MNAELLGSRLALRLNVGLDENFNPIYRTRSYSNIKGTADNQDIFDVGNYFGDLTDHGLNRISRHDETMLEDA